MNFRNILICLFFIFTFSTLVAAQADFTPYVIDARTTAPPPETGFLHMGGISPTKGSLEVNSRYLSIDKSPVLPVMGEFDFARYPPQYWGEELQKMKAGGVTIVSTYVFWNFHEEIEGQFDWEGRRNLRHFIELCGQNGLLVYLRIGPWCHGEIRHGGFPDWLLAKKIGLRRNDPEYLKYVSLYFAQMGKQLHGLFWQQGGPIIGVQLENEYNLSGPGAGAEHIAALKRIALSAGIDPPLFSIFSGNHEFPAHEFIPFTGGYPDKFWAPGLAELPPSGLYNFGSRLPSNLDMGGASLVDTSGKGKPRAASPPEETHHYPLFAAELAGGMVASYRRRTVMHPDDIAALEVTRLGSGVNLYGYYMFHDGSNPVGKLSTLEESLRSGGGHDFPVISYDYNAPLGEFGQERESFRKLKILNLFLRAFGSDLAPMTTYLPDRRPSGPADTTVARIALRASKNSGFLFVNNYVRKLPMPERRNFQVRVKFPAETDLLPRKPVDIPANSYFIWPLNLRMGKTRLRYSTAQLLSRFVQNGQTTYFFFAIPGIPPEFAFARDSVSSVEATGSAIVQAGDTTYVQKITPSMNAAIHVIGRSGRSINIVLLTEKQAENYWQLTVGSREIGFLSPADVFATSRSIHFRSLDRSKLTAQIYSPSANARQLWKDKIWAVHLRTITFHWTQLRSAAPHRTLRTITRPNGSQVVSAPVESDWNQAAEWRLRIPKQPMTGISDIYLRIHYTGDVARLYEGTRLLDDNFFVGKTWEIGMKRFLPQAFGKNLFVKVLPMPENNLIYMEPEARAMMNHSGQTAKINKLEALPEYQVKMPLHADKKGP